MIRQKDLQKIYTYPKTHKWEDNYKRHIGFCLGIEPYRDIGIIYTKDKKEALRIFKERIKNKQYRLKGETYLQFKERTYNDNRNK